MSRMPPEPSPGPLDPHRRDLVWLTGAVIGCTHGLLAGRRRALRLVFEARFGPPDPACAARIAELAPAALDRCLVAAATAADPAGVWSA